MRSAILELPAFREDHLLKCDALHPFRVAHVGDFSVFSTARVLVCNDDPMRAAVFRHCDYKRVGTANALMRFFNIVVRRHYYSNDLLYGHRLFDEKIGLLLASRMAIVARLDLIKNSLRRPQPPLRYQTLNLFLKPFEDSGRILLNVPMNNRAGVDAINGRSRQFQLPMISSRTFATCPARKPR